jgi:hypothetical protein
MTLAAVVSAIGVAVWLCANVFAALLLERNRGGRS